MESIGVGFYGKLPTLGDFVGRRLPRQFTDPWDQWLQASMRASREIHGDDWLTLFLVSPFWRFAISSGLCGDAAWAGVIMPSVDRVGRYYPLTLAQNIDAAQLATVFLPQSSWFEQLETAALSVLEEPFDLEAFDRSLLHIQSPSQIGFHEQGLSDWQSSARCQLPNLGRAEHFSPNLPHSLWERFSQGYSFWASQGGQGDVQFLCFEGMPPVEAYAGFLRALSEESQPVPTSNPAMQPLPYPDDGDEPTIPRAEFLASECQPAEWNSHGISEVGNRRKHNEDAMLDAPQLGLWVVADGMGGHQAGDVASQKVVHELAAMPRDVDLSQQVSWLCKRLQQINAELCEIANQMHPGAVIGSTVVVLVAKAEQCAAIWAGDSRLYRLRGGQFQQLTQDHTLLDELMNDGGMSREEAMQHVGANVITRAVGGQPELELDVMRFVSEAGDRFVLCSDGLDKELADQEIAAGMAMADCQQATQALINTALSRNAIDNITVIVIEFQATH